MRAFKELPLMAEKPALAIALATISCMPTFAQAGGKGHSAHEHGVATANIVAEGNTVTVQLQSPSDSIYGFEHEAKTAADIKKRDDAVEKLKSNADKIFLLDAALGCKIVSSEVKAFVSDDDNAQKEKTSGKKHKAGTHSEVHATFKFECAKAVAGSAMQFAARSQFKSLRTLKVQVLSGDKQGGVTIKNDKGTAQL